ncbi:hypothetical protein [Legionella fallonii]|uniref:Uncharacterized protein n=1 Tax=Legionella fallonii LLAP-10 TaxID=1212491 RepID=A0A098G5K1_9GAMM|nr:hypothetical protein [Legionella fallonii]CEG56770.1 protein of unknown function [Legionella fallonii LLAP-10]
MVIKLKAIILIMLFIVLDTSNAAKKILVERYENWNHPVLLVFKKYGISLYKVSYSKDGTCPTFYAKFKYSPDPRAPGEADFHKVYFDTLKANSFFPYALVDEEDDMRINVGWENKAKHIMNVDMSKAASPSTCKNGG